MVTQFSTKDGLPQNQVIKIIPKRDNSLILYTANGIVNFNGYEFKPLVTDQNYKKQFFTYLSYYSKNDYLFGIDKFQRLMLLSPRYEEIKINNEIPLSFTHTGDSLFVFTQNRNLYLVNLKNLTHSLVISLQQYALNVEPPISQAFIYFQGKFYFSNSKGLFVIDLQTKTCIKKSHEVFIKFKIDPFNKKIYGLTANNVYCINGEIEEVEGLNPNASEARYYDIEFINDNTFFVSGNQGLFYVKAGVINPFGRNQGFVTDNFHSLFYDSLQNCLFAGSAEKGLLKINFKNAYSFTSAQGLSPSAVNSIIKTRDGKILFAQNCCFIKELAGDTAINYSRVKAFFSSLAEVNDVIYAGTWGNGISLIKDGVLLDSINSKEQLQDLYVHAVFKDSKGKIWVGTGKGVAVGDGPKEVKPFLKEKIKETVICFYEMQDGSLCVGVEGGFYILQGKDNFRFIGQKDGFKGKEVRSFYEDAEKKLWVGSYDGGLYCYSNNKLVHINAMRGCMLDKDVFTLAKDDNGEIFMSSNHGLWSVSEKRLNDFYSGRINYIIPLLYAEESGIFNPEFTGGFQNNFLHTSRNNLYFPTLEGVVVVVPKKSVLIKPAPNIDRIYVNDTLITGSAKKFNNATFSVQFDFSTTNFNLCNNIHFQHRLIGTKTYDWSMPQKTHSVYFKMLPPGKYKFVLRVLNGFNDLNPLEASYEFEIEPQLYETVWFRLFIFVLIIVLLFYIVNRRGNEIRKKEKQEEQYNRKVAEIELKAIQAQLNPHFIFNCLNTIKFFILEKDFENANQSLNKFSSLIRDSLENSDKLFIEFGKEIKFINNYIELEKLRMKDQLEYDMQIDKAINPEVKIPRLLIQPYVENSIKHGISNLEHRSGKLNVKFEKIENTIVCTIIDNGIGRVASKILSDRNRLYTSKGTQLTREKSAFLKQYNNYNCTIEIVDLFDRNNLTYGTKVIIIIPLNNDSSDN